MRKIIKTLFMITILICFTRVASAATPTVSINSSSTKVTTGKSFTIYINVSGATFTTVGGTLNFNNSIVDCKKADVAYNINTKKFSYINMSGKSSGTIVSIPFTATKAGTVVFTVTTIDATAMDSNDISSQIGPKSLTVTISNPAPVVTPTVTTNNNAYLKKMSVNVEGLNPMFSKSRTSYSLNVKENVSNINVYATTEDSKATYSISGNKNLAVGDNTIRVVVTASDKKTKKTYTINVTKSNNPELMDATLKSLIIEDITLDPEFDSGVTAYTCPEIDSKVESLNILAVPTNENAKVSITGNTALKAGVNIITIKVTSAGGTIAKSYNLTVNKKEAQGLVNIYGENNNPTPTIDETYEFSNLEKLENIISKFLKENWLSFSLGLFCVLEAICILCLGLKLRKVNKANKPIIQEIINEEKTKRRGNNIIEEISQETIVEEEPLEIKEETIIESENNIEEQPSNDQIDEDTEE